MFKPGIIDYSGKKFILTFNNITNVNTLVGDATNVANWNTLFNLPTDGTVFTSVKVTGTTPCIIELGGGGDIIITSMIFGTYYTMPITAILDTRGVITSINVNALFYGCGLTSVIMNGLTTTNDKTNIFRECGISEINLPALQYVGNGMFDYNNVNTTYNLSSVLELGSDVLDNSVFGHISGKTITLTVPSALMTCNGGNPDGDIQYLQANNTVTIIQV